MSPLRLWLVIIVVAVVFAPVGLALERPAAALGGTTAATSEPTYAITNLGTLHGNFCPGFVGENSFALGLNNSGQVVGGSCAFAGFFERVIHAFLYNGAALIDLRALGPACDVGGRDRGCWHSVARGINGAGQVIGSSSPFFTFTDSQAFIYANGAMTKLLPAATRSDAFGINDSGQVVGWFSTDPIDISVSRAFLFSGGAVTDLGTLGGTRSLAKAINNGGHVVGQASISGDSATHAFMYDGVMRDLGTLGGAHSFASSINSSDQVVGFSFKPVSFISTEEHAFLYRDGLMRDLGTLGGGFSAAFGINDAGEVVGSAATVSGCCHAFLFRAGTMIDLNQLIPAGSGWLLSEASAINNAGQIVGTGSFGGEQRAFLLTPTDTTPPLIAASLSPTPNSQGWNNTNVTLTWNVSDPESGIAFTSGCDAMTISQETAGTTLTCSARNGAGLSASASVLIKIDKTAPTITFSGNAGTYTVDQIVLVTCSASDALSGIATTSCPAVASGPATNFVGTSATTSTTRTATATDNAGNSVSATTTFTVVVAADGICRLTASLTTADAVCAQVMSIATAPNATAKAGKLEAFDNFLAAQSGKSIAADLAALLSRIAHLL